MRHLIGFLLALVVSAALFFGAAWGVTHIVALRGTGNGLAAGSGPAARLGTGLTSTHGLLALAAVLGTGLLIGLLLAARPVSPLATGLPGLVLLGWSALFVLHSQYTLRYLPLPGSQAAAGLTYLLANGVLALAGAAMVVPLFLPSRWRWRGADVEEYDDDIDVPTAIGLVP